MSQINTPFIKVGPSKDDSKPTADKINEEIKKKNDFDIQQLKLTEGQISSMKEQFIPFPSIYSKEHHPGRTIFIPPYPKAGVLPPSSKNAGLYTGYVCDMPGFTRPVTPNMRGMQHNMKISDVSDIASRQYPPLYRPGNSTDEISEYNMFINGTVKNPGPYRLKTRD
jgi:hypothetical protein